MARLCASVLMIVSHKPASSTFFLSAFVFHLLQYLNCKILHGGDAFAVLTKRIWHAKSTLVKIM